MFSVNIDKLIKMTPLEAESYAKAADSLENLLADKGNMLAVVGSGMSSFKLAAAFMEKEKRVLFADADFSQEVFLGKYKLGKNLKGIFDYTQGEGTAKDIICVTNREKLDVVFTGNVENLRFDGTALKTVLEEYAKEYDLVVVQSDEQGRTAGVCDAAVLILEESQYSELTAKTRIAELDKNGCTVLGVIIDE